MTPTRYPLTWPEGWKRTAASARKPGLFRKSGNDLSVFQGVERVLEELAKLSIHTDDVIISTNLQTRLDGYPRSNQAKPSDTGVAVYWQQNPKAPMRCMAVDQYDDVAQNLAAIAATLEAMRAIKRHGGAAILDRAFTGFTALPAPASQRGWREVLEYGNGPAVASQIQQHYRILLKSTHPDHGGTHAAMAELNVARDAALKECE
ncbi:hypothetical protein [Variovorax sp. HJSM1_2]|uniref:hypothetical protein n=1 Tax=Variovorax sp. HJSM1_2 TaxID=3366263 RepID=UPI003BED37FB